MTTVGADCETPAEHAESATIHGLLNCYLRETQAYAVRAAERTPVRRANDGDDTDADVAVVPLPESELTLYAPLRYESPTGRHLFELPVAYTTGVVGAGEGTGSEHDPIELDASTLAALLCRELALAAEGPTATDDVLSRVLSSKANIERFVAAREGDSDRLYGFDTTFRDAEQSLVYGHLMHPTPKSREGIAERDAPSYAPELRGSFPLHYVRADPSIVASDSALDTAAAEWVKAELRADDAVSPEFVAEHVDSDDVLLPLHPWQADYLLDQSHVREAVDEGLLTDLGPVGREYYPTTSVRTVYHPESSFMHKGSLKVAITNSERTNKRPELERGVAISELLATDIGDALRERFPRFDVIQDPAYLTLDVGDESESGFEVVLRENPFEGETATNATPVVGLCQDGVDGPSRLARIVETLAERESRSTEAVARDWFTRYLAISVRPILWLYLRHGVGVEAHQQNSVVVLDDGYPDEFRYRDNQGYYFRESVYDDVDAHLPGVGERADTICPDAVADERIRYYVVLNNVFGVVNALGVAGLVDERDLLEILREELATLQRFERGDTSLVSTLLSAREIRCKANFRTRVEGLDELEGSLENQSVYTEIPNPLVTELDRARGETQEVTR
ncbi:Siderophore synthetase component [Halogranum amylolyticum]|uniref:Siderophore synthetase component n=1 Tax=Halogranum amylolyticum TaxID=660520 RepID=A0A1H8RYV9_9EURY|nr:IucA/IucC family protein [Halogranum amylolyticum]SEO71318.1 Siderophore synthetase component [Halogranum amylolyticum]